MPHISAGRSAKPLVRFRLERQQRQQMINVDAHFGRPAGAPRPYSRTDVIHDRQMRQTGPHAPGHAMREVGRVDDDQNVWRRGNNGVSRLRNSRKELR